MIDTLLLYSSHIQGTANKCSLVGGIDPLILALLNQYFVVNNCCRRTIYLNIEEWIRMYCNILNCCKKVVIDYCPISFTLILKVPLTYDALTSQLMNVVKHIRCKMYVIVLSRTVGAPLS